MDKDYASGYETFFNIMEKSYSKKVSVNECLHECSFEETEITNLINLQK